MDSVRDTKRDKFADMDMKCSGPAGCAGAHLWTLFQAKA